MLGLFYNTCTYTKILTKVLIHAFILSQLNIYITDSHYFQTHIHVLTL